MVEIDYEYMLTQYSKEALMLCSINERFDNESFEVKCIREMYVKIADELIKLRNVAGRSEKSRNYSIAITQLEDSCMRAVKWLYTPQLSDEDIKKLED